MYIIFFIIHIHVYICIHNPIHRKHKRVSLVARNSTVVRFMYSSNCYKMFPVKNFINQSFQETHPADTFTYHNNALIRCPI